MSEQPTTVTRVSDGVARISWVPGENVDVVRREVAAALVDHPRVEAHVAVDDETAQRTATWSGMRREGIMRGVGGDLIVYARLATDTPVHEPGGFRALLNSFLPRKRAISQMLIRDTSPEPRVLLCQLTYKQDWDLPGGVVEVGESPMQAVAREVEEELGLTPQGAHYIGTYEFHRQNQLIIAYHVPATGTVTLNEELADWKHVPFERVRYWPAGTGYALRDWLRTKGIEAPPLELPKR